MTLAETLQNEFPQLAFMQVDLIVTSYGELLIQFKFELFGKSFLMFEQPKNFRDVEDLSAISNRIRYIIESELDAQ